VQQDSVLSGRIRGHIQSSFLIFVVTSRAAASTRVLEYSSTTRVVNCSSNFLLPILEYSFISISGWKFYFRLQFLQSFDELLKFMYSLGFAISFATVSLEPVHSETVTLDQVLDIDTRHAD